MMNTTSNNKSEFELQTQVFFQAAFHIKINIKINERENKYIKKKEN